MGYRIIGDSCLDLAEELKRDLHSQMISLVSQVDDVQVIGDETFDRKKFPVMVKVSPNCPKTACPSPEMLKEAYECDAENIFVITLSSNLNGIYNSMVLAKGLYERKHGKENVAVVDSWSVSSGELNIRLIIHDLCKQEMPLEKVVEKTTQYTQHEMKTYFMLESPDTLGENERLSGLQAFLITTLNIKPVVGAGKGNIIRLDRARGVSEALVRMCELVVREAENPETLQMVVAHCNNEARAQLVKEELFKWTPSKEIIVTKTAGVATVHANDDRIIPAL